MPVNLKIQTDASVTEKDILSIIQSFEDEGEMIGEGTRNVIKILPFRGKLYNIKSFKIPNIVNKIAYRFFRKSKAQRSYEFANKLIDLGIGTPRPIAYYQQTTLFAFRKSYYISEQLDYDLTYRELITNFDYEDYDTILRAFTQFTYKLHEKGIHFLDHSPGNTLIKKVDDDYAFYLVDLNRMQFGPMDFETRIKNFSRLTKYKYMVEIMSDEYAKCSNRTYNEVFPLMWKDVKAFREKFERKKRIKKRFGL